jgi:hypothetical protein
MATQYKHIDRPTQALMSASRPERVHYIQRDRFILHSPLTAVLEVLDDFVRRPTSIRPPCLALVGDAGSGKSTLVREFQRRHATPDDPSTQRVIYCVADAYPELRILQQALMSALDVPAPLSIHRQRWVADDLIQRALAARATRVVIFDEAQHLLNLPRREQAAHWDWIKWVSTANRVSVVCTGIPGFESIIREEGQLETRFTIAYLPRWTVGPVFEQFLGAFERSLPLKRPSGLGTLKMQQALLEESGVKQRLPGITHGIKQVIEYAAIQAIWTGTERISVDLLPAWRRMFEPIGGESLVRAAGHARRR